MNAAKRAERARYHSDILTYFARLTFAFSLLDDAGRAELEAWERTHLRGHGIGTSDWPGWQERFRLDPAPWKGARQ